MMTPAEDLLFSRKSVRSFLPDAVPLADIERMLRAARAAPSGANLQPGRFHVLAGTPLGDVKRALADAIAAKRPEVSEYSYFPKPMPPDLKAKQRAAGFALYQSLGIERRDIEGRKAQFAANYAFFDAPVGIVITIHKDMGSGCYMDLGMAMMGLIMTAEAMGYATCGIGALANHADVVHAHLGLGEEELVVCGMALGRANPDAPVNQFRTERDPLDVFATFKGFNPTS